MTELYKTELKTSIIGNEFKEPLTLLANDEDGKDVTDDVQENDVKNAKLICYKIIYNINIYMIKQ